MAKKKEIKIYNLFSEFPPLISEKISTDEPRHFLDSYEGLLVDLLIKFGNIYNLTFIEEDDYELMDISPYGNVISYERLNAFDNSAELMYSKVYIYSHPPRVERGSFVGNLLTIPLWFFGLTLGTALVLSIITSKLEKRYALSDIFWRFLIPLLQKNEDATFETRRSQHLLNLWFLALIVIHAVVGSFITASVVSGQKIVMNDLQDVVSHRTMKIGLPISDAMTDYFKSMGRDLGRRINPRIDLQFDFHTVANGRSVFINWHEDLGDVKEFCLSNYKNDGKPLLYRSNSVIKVDSVAFRMGKNRTLKGQREEKLNQMIRYMASSCLCDHEIELANWWLFEGCVTRSSEQNDGIVEMDEREMSLLFRMFFMFISLSSLTLVVQIWYGWKNLGKLRIRSPVYPKLPNY